jgi:leucyl-tRNA synthetase
VSLSSEQRPSPVPYDHRAIERRWQAAWQDAGLYHTPSAADAGDRCSYIFTEHPAASQSAPLGLIRSYTISDSYARFMRARGASVLYSVGFQAFGLPIELDALAHDTTPAEWVDRCLARITREFNHLGFSLDFSRAYRSCDPDAYQSSQLLFLTLMERDIIHRSEEQWYLRSGRYLQENEDRLSALGDWNELALSSQRLSQGGGDRDLPIAHNRGWGTPIPVIYCEACGTVPVPVEDLPVRLPENLEGRKAGNPLEQDDDFRLCVCPRCCAQARRETHTLQPIFDGLWQWMAPCVKDIATHALFDDPELARWLPAQRALLGPDQSALIFDQRIIAKALRDYEFVSCLPDGEPFTAVTMHQGVRIGRPKEVNHLEGLVRGIGADAVRLMILYGAAPTTVLTWRGHTLQYCHNWLSSFWDYALPRLQKLRELPEIDVSEGAPMLRRRLAKWSRTAVERVTENCDSVQMHRAARNVMAFVVRIQDFEQRVIDRDGELTSADQRALAQALLTAVQLIAPLTPHIAEELWSAAGRDGFVAASTWPSPSLPADP